MSQIQILSSQKWILMSHLDNTKKKEETERDRAIERELNTCINQIQMSHSKGLNVSDSDLNI